VVADTSITAEFDSYYGNLTMDGGGFRKMTYQEYTNIGSRCGRRA